MCHLNHRSHIVDKSGRPHWDWEDSKTLFMTQMASMTFSTSRMTATLQTQSNEVMQSFAKSDNTFESLAFESLTKLLRLSIAVSLLKSIPFRFLAWSQILEKMATLLLNVKDVLGLN